MIYPTNFEQKIGFDEIRQLLKEKCLSGLGEEYVDNMTYSTNFETINRELDEVCEYIRIDQEEEEDFPANYFYDLRASLHRIRIEGMYLDEKDLFDLLRSLETIHAITRFLGSCDEEEQPRYPHLRALAGDVMSYPQLITRIHQMINPYGKLKDRASMELARIRKELASTAGSISRTLNSILKQAQSEGYVEKDAAPTMRDGRLVIPVMPALKRKIKGIVHDESASGKTIFIEPAGVVEANNRIRELEGEERREVIRILTVFTVELRPHVNDLLYSYQFLGHIDFIRSKALLSIRLGAIKPALENEQLIQWEEAIHPLLHLSLLKHNKKAIPLDIKLNQQQRILIISGPNAGGKSVCLKTVGLLQYMLQCGLPITLHEKSKAGIFDSIFIDIGDEQSIEDELSTYSSHLNNMKVMVKSCDNRSLLLIDEFGGGTEPLIGGAIAESLLKRFNKRGTFGVITTHYQNLKHFADDHEGIVNGAMLYDRHLMQALFQLQIGNPGSSFAVEIARKIGLPEEVIKDASDIVGSEYVNADKYLQDIVRDKRYWEKKRQNIRVQEKQMSDTTARYEEKIKELQKSSKEILRKAKEEAENLLKNSNAKIEATIRTIKEAQADKERTRAARKSLESYKEEIEDVEQRLVDNRITSKMEKLKEKQNRKKEPKQKAAAPTLVVKPKEESIKVGSFVKMKGQTSVGKVSDLKGKKAVVIFGMIKTTVKVIDLQLTTQKASENKQRGSIAIQTQDQVSEKRLQFKQEIDVRGMRGDEAIQAITYFMDDAISLSMGKVRILHGTGTGILRSLTRQYLDTISGVANFQDEHIQFGGSGITVVELE